MFIDASALCAILLREPEAEEFLHRLVRAKTPVTSALAVYEATLALARQRDGDVVGAHERVLRFLTSTNIGTVAIDATVGVEAVAAFQRFGKGRHPARLNMGDCFAYACARRHDTTLMFKGEDFGLTDIASA